MENIGGSCDLHILHAFDKEKTIICVDLMSRIQGARA
jgi:hypothetical protein